MVVCHQIEDVLFKVSAGATDCLHFILTNHLCQRQTDFCCAHGTSHGQKHLSTLRQMLYVSF